MGVQSLVLKWENYQYAVYEGYNYIRIRNSFLQFEDECFTIILVQSDDEGIGIVLAIPSIHFHQQLEDAYTRQSNYWQDVSSALAGLKKAAKTEHRELWVPGFTSERSETESVLAGAPMGGKSVVKAADMSSLEAYCSKPHEDALIFDNMDEAFMIKKGFFFGIVLV